MPNQLNALLRKNISWIMRQKGTLICQIITPLLCLLFIFLVKVIVETQITKTQFGIKLSVPILFNIPIYYKLKYADQIIKVNSCDEWYLYEFASTANDTKSREFFGMNTGGLDKETSGIWTSKSNIIQQYCPDLNKMSPYFQEWSSIRKYDNETSVNKFLFNRWEEFNKYDYNELIKPSLLNILPDGAITINAINEKEFSYKLQINDNRIPFYHRTNGVTQFWLFNDQTKNYTNWSNVINGMLWSTDLFNKAYIKKLFPNETLISGVQWMPIKLDDNEENIQRVINMAGSTFYPMAVSWLLPLFMYAIVLEKENKLIEIMKINGLKMRFYWLSNLMFNYSLYTVTIIIFWIVGAFVLNLSLFTQTHFVWLLLVFVEWGFCQVGLSFFFQSFISHARSATIIGYMVSLWTTIIAVSLNFSIYDLPERYPGWWLLYPTFSLCRIFYYMTSSCAYTQCMKDINLLTGELLYCYIVLFIMGWVFFFLGIYLYEIIPQEFGVRKTPWFCFKSKSKQCFTNEVKKKIKKDEDVSLSSNTQSNEINEDNSVLSYNPISVNDPINDDDIKNEVHKVTEMTQNERSKYPLVTENLTKVYNSNKTKDKTPKKSWDNFTICWNNNEIFGLLGPNGAGKTTFFSLLTGIYEPSSGNAWVCGNSIKENIEKVQEQIGYCPQFDLWWNDLSVEDHLYFYSRWKNVQVDNIEDNVRNTLSNIKLEKYKNFLVKELSGGMKRRLTLGISLVGNPSIVFLDEPTTGLDPENKRQIWDILTNCKENKCMILTTHLMDEAEILSDRIGIIVHGHLKCLGTQFKLKKHTVKDLKYVLTEPHIQC